MALFGFLKAKNESEHELDSLNLNKQVKKSDAESMYQLGNLYEQQKCYDEAEKWWIKADEKGFEKAKFSLAMFYSSDIGGKYNISLTVKYLTELADLGDIDAINCLGEIYSHVSYSSTQPFLAQLYNLKKAEQCFLTVLHKGKTNAWLKSAINLGNIYAGHYLTENKYNDESLTNPMKAAYLFYLITLESRYIKKLFKPSFDEIVSNAHLIIDRKLLQQWKKDYKECIFYVNTIT